MLEFNTKGLLHKNGFSDGDWVDYWYWDLLNEGIKE